LSGNVRPRDLGVHRADRLQQAQVRPDDALLLGDGVEPPGPRVTVAVDVVTQTWDQPGTVPFGLHGLPRQAVPPGVVGRLACAQRRAQEPGGVLCHAQEAGTRTERACRQRALHRLGRRQVREPGGDRGRREPVVGRPASTASNSRVSPGVGRRRAANQNASSPNPTVPMMSSARSWPSKLMRSVVETPSAVGKGSE
jgi:hypothetical protein